MRWPVLIDETRRIEIIVCIKIFRIVGTPRLVWSSARIDILAVPRQCFVFIQDTVFKSFPSFNGQIG